MSNLFQLKNLKEVMLLLIPPTPQPENAKPSMLKLSFLVTLEKSITVTPLFLIAILLILLSDLNKSKTKTIEELVKCLKRTLNVSKLETPLSSNLTQPNQCALNYLKNTLLSVDSLLET
jgi:hypothetical protein